MHAPHPRYRASNFVFEDFLKPVNNFPNDKLIGLINLVTISRRPSRRKYISEPEGF